MWGARTGLSTVPVRSGRGGVRLGLEQADPEVLGLVDALAVRLHPAVGDAEHELGAEDALQVDAVDHLLDGGQHLVDELDLADAERPPPTRGPEPAEEEADHLPQGVEAEAARHDRIALEMAAEEPEIRPHVELGAHEALAVG